MGDPVEHRESGEHEEPSEWADAAPLEAGGGSSALPSKKSAADRLITTVRAKAPETAAESAAETNEPPAEIEAPLLLVPEPKGPSRFDAGDHAHAVQHAKTVFVPRPSVEDPAANVETTSWGRAAGGRSFGWMVWTAGAVLLLIVGGLAIQPLLREQRGVEQASLFEQYRVLEGEKEKAEDQAGLSYFEEHADVVAREMGDILGRYARARSAKEAVPLLRDGEQLGRRLLESWQPWDAPANWDGASSATMGYGKSGNRAYAFMSGSRPDFSPFQMFFVRENQRLLVDWEATEGLCSHSFRELQDPALKEAVVRVVASPTRYYSAAFPESRYRAFQLVMRDKESYLWGYAPLGSSAERQLSAIFQRGMIVNEQTRAEPVRLKLARGEEVGQPNQWVIADMLHKGWVAP